MSILRSQSNVDGVVVPIVLNNNNFARQSHAPVV